MPANSPAVSVSCPGDRAAEADPARATGANGDPFKTPRFNSTEVLRVSDAELLEAARLTPTPGEAPLDMARGHLGEPLPDLIEPD